LKTVLKPLNRKRVIGAINLSEWWQQYELLQVPERRDHSHEVTTCWIYLNSQSTCMHAIKCKKHVNACQPPVTFGHNSTNASLSRTCYDRHKLLFYDRLLLTSAEPRSLHMSPCDSNIAFSGAFQNIAWPYWSKCLEIN
jgi:hypothetical protein